MEITDKNEILKALNLQRPSCKNINFLIFGVSLATINFLISIVITLSTIKYIHYEKNR